MLNTYVKSLLKSAKSTEDEKFFDTSSELKGDVSKQCTKKQCAHNQLRCSFLDSELKTTNSLISQMRQRLVNQEDVISLLKEKNNRTTNAIPVVTSVNSTINNRNTV